MLRTPIKIRYVTAGSTSKILGFFLVFFRFCLFLKIQQEEDEEEDYDIPDQIETIIELLLAGLKDRDTVIRWSAAKGLGRITNRLPLNLAEDVIKFILELYAPGYEHRNAS